MSFTEEMTELTPSWISWRSLRPTNWNKTACARPSDFGVPFFSLYRRAVMLGAMSGHGSVTNSLTVLGFDADFPVFSNTLCPSLSDRYFFMSSRSAINSHRVSEIQQSMRYS